MRITSPRGVVPRAKGCDLPPNFAIKAENMNILSGMFEPWKMPLELLTFPTPTAVAHVSDCCWTGDCDQGTRYEDAGVPLKTYRSRPCDRPMVTDSVCEADWTYLGYPVPEVVCARTYALDSLEEGPDIESRSYVITYGTDCEEGPASCPSDALKADKESYVDLLLPPAPDPKWGVTHIRVYRSASTWDSSQGLIDFNPNSIESSYTSTNTQQDYFLVAEIPVGTVTFTDEAYELGRLLVTQDLLPPEPNAILGGETELGSTVVFWDQTIAFSERNKRWGFPLKTWHDFPYEVKDVKVCDKSVFVFTTGAVYLVSDDVDCTDSSNRPVTHLKAAEVPSLCLSCAVAPSGVLYTASEGLAFVGVDGSSRLVSRLAFGKDDWNALGPIRSVTIGEGMVILLTGLESYLWPLIFDEEGNLPADLTTFSYPVDDWVTDHQGNLYFISLGTVYQFNTGPDYMSMTWWQAEQRTSKRLRVSALLVEYVKKLTSQTNSVSVYRDGHLSVFKQLGHKPRKIKSSATDCFQIRIKGNEPMCALSYGQGFNGLRGDQ
jgi:hypothetical protein